MKTPGKVLHVLPSSHSDQPVPTAWSYSSADLRISLKSDASKVLDMDFPKGDVHIWSRSQTFQANQQWIFDKGLFIAAHHNSSCLSAGVSTQPGTQLTLAPCNHADPKQQWVLDSDTGHLTCAAASLTHSASQRTNYAFTAGLCVEANDNVPMATATFTPTETGQHSFYIELNAPPSFGAGFGITLKLISDDNQSIVDWEALTNLPNGISGKGHYIANKPVRVSLSYKGFKGNQPKVYVRGPKVETHTISSLFGQQVDYWVVAGDTDSLDGAIAGYRQITGAAPLYGQWVYGFWQCKEHYATQQGLLDAAHGFRNRYVTWLIQNPALI